MTIVGIVGLGATAVKMVAQVGVGVTIAATAVKAKDVINEQNVKYIDKQAKEIISIFKKK